MNDNKDLCFFFCCSYKINLEGVDYIQYYSGILDLRELNQKFELNTFITRVIEEVKIKNNVDEVKDFIVLALNNVYGVMTQEEIKKMGRKLSFVPVAVPSENNNLWDKINNQK